MPVHNSEIAGMLGKVADLLEIQGENQFRVRAYREAARVVSDHPRSVAEMVGEGEDISELSHGERRSSVSLRSGLQTDLRVVPKESFGAALLYFTGARSHHLAL